MHMSEGAFSHCGWDDFNLFQSYVIQKGLIRFHLTVYTLTIGTSYLLTILALNFEIVHSTIS